MAVRIAFYDAFGYFEGSGRAMLDIVDRLDRYAIDPIVVCPREGELIAAATARGYETHVMPAPGRLKRYGGALLTGGALALPLTGAAMAWYGARLSLWLRKQRVRLLHCNQTRAALQAGPAGRLAGIPVVWVSRSRDTLPRLATRLGAWCSDAVVSLSPTCLEDFEGVEILRDKSIEIPLGIDTGRFCPQPDAPVPDGLGITRGQPVVTMVGALHPRKRHDVLVEAAPEIVRRVPAVRILIVGGEIEDGDGDYAPRLRARVKELGVEDSVCFTGRRSDVPAILRMSGAFVLPSDREGLPGAVVEAMATELATIVTPAAAAPVIDGETGLVVAEGDPAALADATARVLIDRDMAERMGTAGRERAREHYSLETMVPRYVELYERLLGGFPNSGPVDATDLFSGGSRASRS